MYMLPALTLHEAVPGHHLQIEFGRVRLERLASIQVSVFKCISEKAGGLYAEYLGKEAGYYKSTPYEEFGRLSYEMWRACQIGC